MSDGDWASDVPVSLPEPVAPRYPGERRIAMRGFVFTIDGLFLDLDATTHDALSIPTYSPQNPVEVIYDDRSEDIEFT